MITDLPIKCMYLSAVTVTDIFRSFTYKMAAEIKRHTGWAKKGGHRLMTIILSNLNRFNDAMNYVFLRSEVDMMYMPLSVPSLPALGPWAPPAERGPSLESIYRVSLTVDLCEG